MRRVHTSESLAAIGHARNVLERAGIRCTVRNETLSGALGEVPFLECLPELWVVHDDDLIEAQRILDDLAVAPADAPAWSCLGCGETNDGAFAACWRCGRADQPR